MQRLLAPLLCLALGGCAELASLLAGAATTGARVPPPPAVTVAAVRPTQLPTPAALAAYACPKVAPEMACALFGAVLGVPQGPPVVAFDVELEIQNPAQVPVPLAELLVGITVFPDAAGQRNLGATCITPCPTNDGCAEAARTACRSDQRDIRTIEDFAGAVAGLLVQAASGQAQLENLRVRTVEPGATLRAVFHFEIGIDALVELLRTVAEEAVDAIGRGQAPELAIPWKIEGTLWVTVDGLGRIGVPLPATRGSFAIR